MDIKTMKPHKLLLALLAVLSIGLSSCQSNNDEPNTPAIQVGTGVNLSEITLHINGEQRLALSGGNKKYSVSIENAALASAKVEDAILILKGLTEGETYLVLRSGDRTQRVHIKVKPPTLLFSAKTLELEPKQTNSTIRLTGGNAEVKLEAEDPLEAITYQWKANGELEIRALREGIAKITAKLAGQPDQVLEVRVSATNKPTKAGIYRTEDSTPYELINSLFVYRNKATGVTTLSAKARPYGNHQRVIVPAFTRPQVGEWIELDLKFEQVQSYQSQKYRFYVESVGEKTSLLSKGFRLVLTTP